MRYLMGVKNCHCCSTREGCHLKNSKANLTNDTKKEKKTMMPKVRSVPVPGPCRNRLFLSRLYLGEMPKMSQQMGKCSKDKQTCDGKAHFCHVEKKNFRIRNEQCYWYKEK